MRRNLIAAMLGTAMASLISTAAIADGVVKLTPLGGQDGEFCRLDRALILEDPNGTRLLYDAGRTAADPDDPRLGKIDAVLAIERRQHGL
jgi:hypothetical protein